MKTRYLTVTRRYLDSALAVDWLYNRRLSNDKLSVGSRRHSATPPAPRPPRPAPVFAAGRGPGAVSRRHGQMYATGARNTANINGRSPSSSVPGVYVVLTVTWRQCPFRLKYVRARVLHICRVVSLSVAIQYAERAACMLRIMMTVCPITLTRCAAWWTLDPGGSRNAGLQETDSQSVKWLHARGPW